MDFSRLTQIAKDTLESAKDEHGNLDVNGLARAGREAIDHLVDPKDGVVTKATEGLNPLAREAARGIAHKHADTAKKHLDRLDAKPEAHVTAAEPLDEETRQEVTEQAKGDLGDDVRVVEHVDAAAEPKTVHVKYEPTAEGVIGKAERVQKMLDPTRENTTRLVKHVTDRLTSVTKSETVEARRRRTGLVGATAALVVLAALAARSRR